jgi:cytoskeletal protein RodZ
MASIGANLRQRREQLGLTLEEAERVTRIRSLYLQALERDDPGALPSPVQARGFLKNYADYLGLRSEEILRQYVEQTGGRRTIPLLRPASVPAREALRAAAPRALRRRWFSMDLIVAAVISLGTLALLIWGGGRLMASLRERTEQARGASAFLISTATASSTSTATDIALQPVSLEATQSAPTATLPPLPLPSGRVTLRIIVQQRAWLRVVVDGRQEFQGRVVAGDVLDYAADRVIEVSTGNGAALRISWNGQDLGLLGALDEVITRLWTSVAMLTPTPTVTATFTASPPPTSTPVPSPTTAGAGG